MAPYQQCPACQRTTWLRGDPAREPVCERCGSALDPHPRRVSRLLAAVRARYARDMQLDASPPRFVRDRR